MSTQRHHGMTGQAIRAFIAPAWRILRLPTIHSQFGHARRRSEGLIKAAQFPGQESLREFDRGLRLLGFRVVAVGRTAVLVACGLLALLAVHKEGLQVTAGVVAAAMAWSAVHYVGLVRFQSRWLVPADVVAIGGLCMSQAWTVPPEALYDGTSWVLVAASITVVGYQWHTEPVTGAVATVVVAVAYLAGSALAAPTTWAAALPMGLWMLVEAALSRGLFVAVQRGGRRADALHAQGEQARRDAAVAAARRAETREYLAALHDTAAATLLMVGMGVVGGRQAWLSEQAGRDLEVLVGQVDVTADEVDLAEMLSSTVRRSRLRVDWTPACPLVAPPVPAVAICRSLQEALANVRRHAGVDTAVVRAERQGHRIVVEVADAGIGFEPARIPPHRRGVSHSIIERMDRAGGHASVMSRAGHGTRIRLEWPRG
jgi:signal transduction histidine kinase